MGVTEKTLGSKAFLENGSLTGAVGGGSGGGMFEEDVMKERKVRVAMDKRVDRDSDRGSRGTAVREEETPAQQVSYLRLCVGAKCASAFCCSFTLVFVVFESSRVSERVLYV